MYVFNDYHVDVCLFWNKQYVDNTVDSPVPPVNASPSVEVPGVVATWNGGTLNYEEGTKAVKGQLIQLEAEYLTNTYQTAMQGIEQAIFEKILEEEVKSWRLRFTRSPTQS